MRVFARKRRKSPDRNKFQAWQTIYLMHVLRGCSSCPRLAGWLLFVDGLDRPAPLVRLQRAMDMPTPHKARYLAANEPRRNSPMAGRRRDPSVAYEMANSFRTLVPSRFTCLFLLAVVTPRHESSSLTPWLVGWRRATTRLSVSMAVPESAAAAGAALNDGQSRKGMSRRWHETLH